VSSGRTRERRTNKDERNKKEEQHDEKVPCYDGQNSQDNESRIRTGGPERRDGKGILETREDGDAVQTIEEL
jgi:hypothetical protein